MPCIREAGPDALMLMTGRAERLYKDQSELARYDAQIDQYIQDHHLGDHIYIGDSGYDDSPLTALGSVVIYTTIGNEPFGLVPVQGIGCTVLVGATRSRGTALLVSVPWLPALARRRSTA